MKQWKFIVILWLVLTMTAYASETLFPFVQSRERIRFEHLLRSYRCVVCANQTIAESEASLAQDLRQLIYHKVLAGETDEQIDRYLIERFGAFIQYRPAWGFKNLGLWFIPLGAGLMGIWVVCRAALKANKQK